MSSQTSPSQEHTDRFVRSFTLTLNRAGILTYGIASYSIGVAALVALIMVMLGVLDFTGGPVRIASRGLDSLFDVGLMAAFGLQHTGMARASFKRWWTRICPPALERPTYMLATGVVLLAALWLWQPLPLVLWTVDSPIVRPALTGFALLGWAYLFAATFAIDHFELFGLKQAWGGFRGKAPGPVPFRERWMYRFDRHPIMTGLLVGIWVTPEMTLGHAVFAAVCTLYVVIGVRFEERALRRQWAQTYEDYRRRVPTIVPLLARRSGHDGATTEAGAVRR